MSDLVKRLRAFTIDRGVPTMPINVHPSCCTEAANEIERLQDAIIKAANAMADGEPYGHIVAILERAAKVRA